MKVLIVEDEKHARLYLESLLTKLDPKMEIVAYFDKVSTTVDWLKTHEVDLIFLDIHLADALSFNIFDQVQVKSPIIFTTAYDHYAIKAFEVNSIAYLLKPFEEEDLQRALEKYHQLHQPQQNEIQALKEALTQKEKTYQQRFMVKKGEMVASIKIGDVAYFEGEDRYVRLVKKDGKKYYVDYKLSDLEELLDPEWFFRLNRSFICHFDAIESILTVSKSRLQVALDPPTERKIVISTENTRSFKGWLNR